MDNTQEETRDTSNVVSEPILNPDVETQDTTKEQDAGMNNLMDDVFGEPKEEIKEEPEEKNDGQPEEKPDAETSNEETEKPDSETEEVIKAEFDEDALPIEIKTTDSQGNELTETLNFNDETDRKKVIQYAQKGRHYEREMQVLNDNKKILAQDLQTANQLMLQNSYLGLFLQSQGKIKTDELMELPFDSFVGKSEVVDENGDVVQEATNEGDIRLWNEHKTLVSQKRKNLNDYITNARRYTAEMDAVTDSFFSSHPEIIDRDKWMKENVQPYYEGVISFGAKPMPKDFLEMVHFFKNKDKFIQEERKKIIKAKPVIQKSTQDIALAGRTSTKSGMKNLEDDILGKD
jgi:hypothetical protein